MGEYAHGSIVFYALNSDLRQIRSTKLGLEIKIDTRKS
jgi:hypothetical protein